MWHWQQTGGPDDGAAPMDFGTLRDAAGFAQEYADFMEAEGYTRRPDPTGQRAYILTHPTEQTIRVRVWRGVSS